MQKKAQLILFTIYFVAAAVFYTPYLIKNRFQIIERNWDGPAYIVIAKTFYLPKLIKRENYIKKYLPEPEKFAEKLPLTSVFIRIFSFMSYEKSMLFVSSLFGFLSILVFYRILLFLKIQKPLLLTVILIFFPPRWFAMQKVGGAEPVFLFFTLLSLLFYFRNKYLLSGLMLFFATLAKINGLLIFASYFLIFIFLKKNNRQKFIYYCLSPLGIAGLFYYYSKTFGNFWAFFQRDSRCYESMSLFKFPYSVFDASACYVQTIHLDEIFWFYTISYLAIIILLKRKKWELLLFFTPSFIPMLFLQHKDFTRHGIFLYFLLGIIYAKFLTKKEALIVFILLLPAVYLYARNFINVNVFIP